MSRPTPRRVRSGRPSPRAGGGGAARAPAAACAPTRLARSARAVVGLGHTFRATDATTRSAAGSEMSRLHEVQRRARQHVLRGAEVVALQLGQGLHVQAGDARQRAMLRGHREEARRPARTRRAGRDTRAARLNSTNGRWEISFCCCFLSPPRGRAVAHVSNFSRARRVPFWAPTDWCAAERGAAERLGRPRNRGGGAERRAYPVKRRRATGVAGVATGRNSSGPAVR